MENQPFNYEALGTIFELKPLSLTFLTTSQFLSPSLICRQWNNRKERERLEMLKKGCSEGVCCCSSGYAVATVADRTAMTPGSQSAARSRVGKSHDISIII